ncbi:hypothetical protein B0I35DRAFT_483598 [Stachybotrys elegans]|uniref:NAD(P)-binding domain-containing protein n=1 Tax=Stachybotrys elegans TaxID=80388 RepID=A0A8K0WM95_9HYPO|nr:hypothetical protein B0I35DRAFT_483598 [Stachybotrys elegans]
MSNRVVLIFGAGARVGRSVAQAFGAKGYKVALAARSLKAQDSTKDQLHIPTDCSDPESIVQAFSQVRSAYGSPNVVVYNAAAGTRNSSTDVFEVPLDAFRKSASVNILGPYAAAQQAVKGWADLPASASPTFIYTGNCTNVAPIDWLLDSTVGKTAAATIIQIAAGAYKEKGYKFYYADERREDGSPVYNDLSGEGHAKLYTDLAEGPQQLPWPQTFVTGLGYKKF